VGARPDSMAAAASNSSSSIEAHTNADLEAIRMSDTESPNAQQIEYWNEVSGPKWVQLSDDIDSQIGSIGFAAMDRAKVEGGERVLDVGCGCGQTSIELARRVGSSGFVQGLDISGPMLEDARRRARETKLENTEFVQADAQTHPFGDDAFDLVFSRFGVMFFADPPAAFANLRSALKPGGRLTFACWQAVTDNPWMLVPVAAALQHVEIDRPPDPDGPGPFAFADREKLHGILDSAGYSDIQIDDHRQPVDVAGGKDLDATVDFLLQRGPAGAALRDADEAKLAAAAKSVRDAIAPYEEDGHIWLNAAVWIASARG
jgi:SAM-dependent methyltransferase